MSSTFAEEACTVSVCRENESIVVGVKRATKNCFYTPSSIPPSKRLQQPFISCVMAARVSGWRESTPPQVKHYKISFDLNRDLRAALQKLVGKGGKGEKLGPNYAVIVRRAFKYVVFFNGFVNAVGIKKEEEIREAVDLFKNLVNVPPDLEVKYRVDNLTLSGHFAIDLSLSEIARGLLNILEGESEPKISFKPAFFTAVHVRHSKGCDLGGTFAIFHTGRYSLVGVKTVDRANTVFSKTSLLLAKVHEQNGRVLQ